MMKMLVMAPLLAMAGAVWAERRNVNVWYPGETAEPALKVPALKPGGAYEIKVCDWHESEVLRRGYDPACGGRLAFTEADTQGKFGAFGVFLVEKGTTNAPLTKTWFARLTSREVKPCPWIGTGGHTWKSDYVQGPPEKREGPYLDMLSAAGVGVFRQDFCWHAIERQKGVYSFSEADDNLFSQFERRGIAWQLLMTWSNTLYENNLDPEGFAAFCRATAQHWKGRVKHYEIFNEPQHTPWREVYPREARDANSNLIWVVKFSEFTRTVARALHEADPGATVAVTGEDDDWLLYDMIRLGCAQKGDLISFHPYCHFQPRPEREYWFKDGGRYLRELAAAHGGASRFCITEAGWPTFQGKVKYLEIVGCYPRSSLDQQARYQTRMYILARQTGIEYACQYCWKDEGLNPSYTEDNFGQLFYDATPKPAFAATAFLARLLGQAKVIGEKSPKPDQWRAAAFLHENGKAVVTACWNIEGDSEVPCPQDLQGAKFYDLMGNAIPSPITANGKLKLTEFPIYAVRGKR